MRLLYWIREREKVRKLKESGAPKPWSEDPVFQTTYFCNVRREDDRVTRFIREWARELEPLHGMFAYNMIMARFINHPDTLTELGPIEWHDPQYITDVLTGKASRGEKVWGNAYVITTHGIPMGKVQYLVENVLGGALRALDAHANRGVGPWYGEDLATACAFLEQLEGLGPFLSAQVVADLKNTPGHPLQRADDWWTFVSPGPGSCRGASWFFYAEPGRVSYANFHAHFKKIREWYDFHVQNCDDLPSLCSQDLQNCLCEFDKYMRVSTGTGRSKRNYNGIHNG